MTLAKRLKLIFIATAALLAASCSDKDNDPLSLADVRGSLQLTFPHEPYAFSVRGGDGSYTATSGDDRILYAAISGSVLTLRSEAAGTTELTITDGSGETLRIPVTIEAYRQRMVVEKLYARASGEKLDPSDKATIEARALETILIAAGGGFDFVYTGYSEGNNPAGIVTIYPETFGTGGTETPFERMKIEEGMHVYTCYVFTAGGRERRYIISEYNGRSTAMQEMALTEDVTGLFEENYPTLENAYTQMSVSQPEH